MVSDYKGMEDPRPFCTCNRISYIFKIYPWTLLISIPKLNIFLWLVKKNIRQLWAELIFPPPTGFFSLSVFYHIIIYLSRGIWLIYKFCRWTLNCERRCEILCACTEQSSQVGMHKMSPATVHKKMSSFLYPFSATLNIPAGYASRLCLYTRIWLSVCTPSITSVV